MRGRETKRVAIADDANPREVNPQRTGVNPTTGDRYPIYAPQAPPK